MTRVFRARVFRARFSPYLHCILHQLRLLQARRRTENFLHRWRYVRLADRL